MDAHRSRLLRTTLLSEQELSQHAEAVTMPAHLGSLLGNILGHLRQLFIGR